jgi:hypothetical protein
MKRPQSFARALLLLPLLLASCSSPASVESTDRGDDGEESDTGTPPDLPCGGADFMTDDRNCGTCGNECGVVWPGTDYTVGGCVAGECGPVWSKPLLMPHPPEVLTCNDVCGLDDRKCLPRACADLTGYVCVGLEEYGATCNLGNPKNFPPIEVVTDCDESVPYPNGLDDTDQAYLGCCCERP